MESSRAFPGTFPPRLLTKAIACCFPDVRLRDVRPVEKRRQGWDSHTFIVNRNLVFQTPRDRRGARAFQRQQRLLLKIRDAMPLPVPRFEYATARCPTLGLPLAGYRRIPGRHLTRARLMSFLPSRRRAMARDLGTFLGVLHGIPSETLKSVRLPIDDGEPHDAWRADLRRAVFPRLSPDRQKDADRLLDEWTPPAAPRERTLCHNDLSDDHIFVGRDGQVTGVIDWADASLGDPTGDFGGLVLAGGCGFAQEVLRHYPRPSRIHLDRPLLSRLRCLPLEWLHYALRASDASLYRRSLQTLDLAMRREWPLR